MTAALSSLAVRLALAVPCLVHGVGNLAAGGRVDVVTAELPAGIVSLVGVCELLAAGALVLGVLCRVAAGLLLPIFVGAVVVELGSGGAWDPALSCLLLSAAIATGASTRVPAQRATEVSHVPNHVPNHEPG